MSRFTCPWCNRESDYVMERKKGTYWGKATSDSPIIRMNFERIECRCPLCKGTFDAIPELEAYAVDISEPVPYRDAVTGEEFTDWDLESYDIDALRREYMVQEGYVERKSRFSLTGKGGFSLPAPAGQFSLPPAKSGFSLFNLRRRKGR